MPLQRLQTLLILHKDRSIHPAAPLLVFLFNDYFFFSKREAARTSSGLFASFAMRDTATEISH